MITAHVFQRHKYMTELKGGLTVCEAERNTGRRKIIKIETMGY
jgi:hypothetical protein